MPSIQPAPNDPDTPSHPPPLRQPGRERTDRTPSGPATRKSSCGRRCKGPPTTTTTPRRPWPFAGMQRTKTSRLKAAPWSRSKPPSRQPRRWESAVHCDGRDPIRRRRRRSDTSHRDRPASLRCQAAQTDPTARRRPATTPRDNWTRPSGDSTPVQARAVPEACRVIVSNRLPCGAGRKDAIGGNCNEGRRGRGMRGWQGKPNDERSTSNFGLKTFNGKPPRKAQIPV